MGFIMLEYIVPEPSAAETAAVVTFIDWQVLPSEPH
jgi:hypothetical protein